MLILTIAFCFLKFETERDFCYLIEIPSYIGEQSITLKYLDIKYSAPIIMYTFLSLSVPVDSEINVVFSYIWDLHFLYGYTYQYLDSPSL